MQIIHRNKTFSETYGKDCKSLSELFGLSEAEWELIRKEGRRVISSDVYCCTRLRVSLLEEGECLVTFEEADVHSDLHSLIQSLDDIVFELNMKGQFRAVWTADESKLFMPKDRFLGQTIPDVFPPDLADELMKAIGELRSTGIKQRIRYSSPEDPDRHFEAALSVVRVNDEPTGISVIIREVTAEVQRNAELREALARLEIITSLPQAPVIYTADPVDLSGRFVSKNVESLTGYHADSPSVRIDWAGIVTSEDLIKVFGTISSFINSEERVLQLQYRIKHRDGRTLWIQEYMQKELNAAGKLEAIHGTMMDITPLKEAMNELLIHQDLLTRAGRMAKLGGWEYDPHTRSTVWSDEVYRIYAISEDTVVDPHMGLSFYHPDDQDRVSEHFKALVRHGEAYDIEARLIDTDGKQKWLRSIGVAKKKDGRVEIAYGILQDISEAKRREVELHESLELFNQVFDNAPLGIAIVSTEGRWVQVNPSLCSMLGYAPEELIGKRFGDITHKEDISVNNSMLDLLREGKEEHYHTEKRYMRKDGTTVWVELNASVVRKNGKVRFFVSQIVDITERHNYQSKLLKAREEAEKAARVKSEFLAQMSHEIRTPMNAIVGITNLLYQDLAGDKDLYEKVSVLKFGAENLLSIVNDILDLSKIEQGKLRIENMSLNIRDIVTGVKGIYSQRAEEKGLKVRTHVEENVPERLFGDPQRITQILNNLVSNAIKFTEKGAVTVHVSGEVKGPDFEIVLSVKDTGVGIEDSFVDRIFEPFSQGLAEQNRRMGGTGLGLSISKRLADLMQAGLKFNTTVGEGTEFILNLTLPVAFEEKHVSAQNSHSGDSLMGRKILMVEDNSMNIYVARRFMDKWKIDVEVEMSGETALGRDDLDQFELLLMDMQLPGINGLDTIRAFRERGVEAPALMLTAATDVRDNDQDWDQLRIIDVVFKPFVPDDLFRKIQLALSFSVK